MKRITNEAFIQKLQSVFPTIRALEPYKNAREPISFECLRCHHKWRSSPDKILKSSCGCKECWKKEHFKKRTKTTKQFVEEMMIANPSIRVVGEYITARKPIDCECLICHHSFSALPTNLLRGKGCGNCSGNIKITKEIFIERLKKKSSSIEPLEEYIGLNHEMKFRCNVCGKEWSTLPSTILYGVSKTGCPRCSGNERVSRYEFVRRLKEKHPQIKLVGKYTSMEKSAIFICKKCGARFSKKPYSILKMKHPCGECEIVNGANPNRRELMVKKIQKRHPGILLLDDYVDAHTKIKYVCLDCGNVLSKSPTTLLKINYACTHGSRYFQTSFPEQAIFYYIKSFYFDAISGYKEGFGKSELDVFIPSKKIGIEYDGKWHSTEKISKRDEKKYLLCKEMGIFLIRIKTNGDESAKISNCDSQYNISKEPKNAELSLLIQKVLKQELGINTEIDVEKDRLNILGQYYNSKLKKSLATVNPFLAGEWHPTKNGLLKPTNVPPNSGITVWWKCQNGHEWPATIASRNSGVGCQDCLNLRRKESFARRFKSTHPKIDIVGNYTRIDSPLEVKCKCCGHTWISLPKNLLVCKGCPNCHSK